MFLSLSPRVTTATAPDPTFVSGYLDAATITGVSGWAGPGPTHVTVTVNSVVISSTVLTDQARPDVLVAGPPTFPYAAFGVCGFSYSFNPPLDGAAVQHIVVSCQGSTITNGDKTLPGSGGGGGTAGYITDPALQTGAVVQQGIAATMPNNDSELASHPSVLFYEPFDSVAAMQTRWTHANAFYNPGPSLPSIDIPTVFVTDPKSGVRMMQTPIQLGLNSSPGQGGTGCSWHRAIADQTLTELYCRYLLIIYPDVNPVYDPTTGVETNGMNDIGVKLPGLSGAYEDSGEILDQPINIGVNGGWSHRFWHAAPVAYNIFPFRTYTYDYTANVINGNPFGDEDPIGNTAARGGQVYCIEHRLRLNTLTGVDATTHKGTPVADGISEWWIDGVKVYSDTARKIRGDERVHFEEFFQNVFHGGSNPVVGRITYATGGHCIATQYIGPPKRVIGNYRNATSDAFYASLPLNTWTAIPNSAMTNLIAQTRSGYLEYGVIASAGTQGRTIDANGLSGLFNWGGAAWNDTAGDLTGDAGGHNSTNNNSVWRFSPELAASGDAYGGWRYVSQPSIYTQAQYNTWIAAQSGDCHFENGINYPTDDGTWADGLPGSRHSYNSPVIWKGGQAYIRASARLARNGFYFVDVSSGTHTFIPGNGFFGNSSSSYLQGNNYVDETNGILLGFQNWPNGASLGVRRFNLNTKTDMAPIDLTNLVLSQDSNWTAGLYYTETTWCQTGAGCMVGREFHYAMSEGSQRYFHINIDTWVAKELKLTGLPARIGTAMVYVPDNGYLYAISCDTGALMRGNPTTGAWGLAPAFGSGPIIDANLLVGVYGRFFYHSARKCLTLISASNDNVRVMRVA